jgi:hypothetical protein
MSIDRGFLVAQYLLLLLWEYREDDQKVAGRKSSGIGIRLDLENPRARNVDWIDDLGGWVFLDIVRSIVRDLYMLGNVVFFGIGNCEFGTLWASSIDGDGQLFVRGDFVRHGSMSTVK